MLTARSISAFHPGADDLPLAAENAGHGQQEFDGCVRLCHVWQNLQVQRQLQAGEHQGAGLHLLRRAAHAAGGRPQEVGDPGGGQQRVPAHQEGLNEPVSEKETFGLLYRRFQEAGHT